MAAGGEGLAPCLQWSLADTPMSCALSPATSHLAVGLVTGGLEVYSYSHDTSDQQTPFNVQQMFSMTAHGEGQSCRATAFSLDGAYVISGGHSRKLIATAINSHKQAWCQDAAHDAAVSLLRVLPAGGPSGSGIVVSGDEDGGLKVWDMRARKQVMGYKKHSDYISDAVLHARDMALVVTSGDGTLSVHDIRTCKFRARSESDADDEMLSAAVVKGGKKVVCGCGSGVLALYSWGYFNDCSDRFPGHPESVDAIIAFDDDTIITGSSDGMLRVLNVLPNKLLGVIGSHDEFPVEAMALSSDSRRVLASISHDAAVRLWDLGVLHDDGGEGDDQEEEEEQEEGVEARRAVPSQGEAGGAGSGDGESDEEGAEGGSEQEGSEEGSDDPGSDSHPGIGVRLPAKAGAGSKHSSNGAGAHSEDRDAAAGSSEEGERREQGRQGAGRGASGQQSTTALDGKAKEAGGQQGGGSKAATAAVQKPGTSKQPGSKLAKLQASEAANVTPAEGQGQEGSDDDSDESDEDASRGKASRKQKRRQRERTRWTQDQEKKAQRKNFFSDLL